MGLKEVKKWFALGVLGQLTDDKPHELMLRALTRAKLAEELAPNLGMAERSSELFLLGMFSLIDAVLDSEMTEIMEELPLDQQIKKALLGYDCRLRTALDMILSYEKAEWEEFSRRAEELHVKEELVPRLVLDSQEWANAALSAV
jgi:EAL and modified HD-GYP domain-containing signal transduction protein